MTLLFLVFINLAYSLVGLISKELVQSLGVYHQIFLRMSVALICALIFSFNFLYKISKRDHLILLVRAFCLSIPAAGFYILALKKSSLGAVTVVTMLPYDALIGLLLFKEKLSTRQILCLTMAFLSSLLLLDVEFKDFYRSGVFLAFVSGIFWAIGIPLARYCSKDIKPETQNLYGSLYTVIFTGVTSYFNNSALILPENLKTLFLVILGGVCVFIGSLLTYKVISKIKLAEYSLFGLSQIPITILLGWFCLNEQISAIQLIAFLLIGLSMVGFYRET